MNVKFSGSAHVYSHMLNAESRKYFKRAFMISGAMSYRARRHHYETNIQECLQTNKMQHELVEYLKTANVTALAKCNDITWLLSIEKPSAARPFLTETFEEIYRSGKMPVMDAMFSIVSQVIDCFGLRLLDNQIKISLYFFA